MKKLIFLLMTAFSIPLFACNPVASDAGENSTAVKPARIQVYYFHYERRCATCNAVEDVTKKTLNELYAAKMKSGDITFQSINLEEKAGEELGNKLKVAGQALIIIKGDKQTDLTEQGFMYARSSPEKLKAEIKKAIDAALK